jgi:hypothetical protein
MTSENAPRGVKLLITIVDQGKGEAALRLLNAQSDHFHLICLGEGTARADTLELLGLRSARKDVVFSTLEADRAQEALAHLRLLLNLDQPGGGQAGREFFGVSIQPEKEMLMILVKSQIKCPVMQAILKNAGNGSPAHAVCFSLPVDGAIGVAE